MDLKKKTAPEGAWLTQAAATERTERIMVKEVSGFGDLDSLYRVATDDEYNDYLAMLAEQESRRMYNDK